MTVDSGGGMPPFLVHIAMNLASTPTELEAWQQEQQQEQMAAAESSHPDDIHDINDTDVIALQGGDHPSVVYLHGFDFQQELEQEESIQPEASSPREIYNDGDRSDLTETVMELFLQAARTQVFQNPQHPYSAVVTSSTFLALPETEQANFPLPEDF